MKISQIFIESEVESSPIAQNILCHYKNIPIKTIDKIEDTWGRVKKPYLQKRESLNLFIGNKKGQLVKEAPDAYGHGKEKHYYFIHAYNCIYECEYCYLQGYFNTPDLVIFVNHEEIISDMQQITDSDPNHDPWFHAGEFSDSLALSNITKEFPLYWEFFKQNPLAKLEIRTKSVNISQLKNLPPLENIYISFTLSTEKDCKDFDLNTPGLKQRLNAIKTLAKRGYQFGIHFDPLIYRDTLIEEYEELTNKLLSILPEKQLGYISIGVVRFTKDVYSEVKRNYPKSKLLSEEFITSFDGKIRYNKPMRLWILNNIKSILVKAGITEDKVYLCMENE